MKKKDEEVFFKVFGGEFDICKNEKHTKGKITKKKILKGKIKRKQNYFKIYKISKNCKMLQQSLTITLISWHQVIPIKF